MESVTEAARKSVKKGIDSDASRKNREEKGIQLRKDKRLDRANVERRKFKIDDDGEKNPQSTHTRIRNMEILPKKCELLLSDDVAKQTEAAVYFRRILAADKFPPLDIVIETKMIVPILISFLCRFEAPTLQIEAAWSITNIACGESKHIYCLVANGAIPELIKVIARTPNATLRDQALWAICNISSDDYACQQLLYFPNILVPLIRQVGLNCPLYHQIPDGVDVTIYANNNVTTLTQFSMPDFPSLSTMRHVAFTLGNFARLRTQLSAQEYYFIIYTFADLIQSPDEEIVSDICNSLITLSQDRPECISVIAEQGLISRVKEFFDLTTLSEIAILVVCAVVKTCCQQQQQSSSVEGTLIRLSALSHNSENKPILQYIIELLGRTTSEVTRRDIGSTLAELLVVDHNKYAVQMMKYGIIDKLCTIVQQGCPYDIKVEAGQIMCKIVLNANIVLDAHTSNQASAFLYDLLSCTDYLLLSLSLQALLRLFSMAIVNQILVDNYTEVSDKMDLLTIHPFAHIAEKAQELERLMVKYTAAVNGVDGY